VVYRLAGVYAHPDDDTYGLGGILAKHGEEIDYTLIVATSGEAGMIADPALATQENLARVREAEELEALSRLGVTNPDVHFLRHPDGGLADVPRDQLVRQIVGVLRAARPQIVVTFGPEGITRHEDHIAIGRAATEAFHEARTGATEGFDRLFYNAIPQSDLEAYWEASRKEGIDPGDPEAPFAPRGVPDHTITARVDCRDVFGRKFDALQAHRTQAEGVNALPAGIRQEIFGVECFVLAWPPVTNPDGPIMSILFEGLEETIRFKG
jgi:LmbE family N-acetylglucosaminyl deacetylase